MGGGQRPLLAGSMMMDGVVALYRGRLRPWMYTWGARVDEVTAQLPGDGLVEAHTPRTTRAVTIDALIADVWPCLRRSGRTAAASTATPCWNAQSACMCTMRTASTLSGRTCASATRVWLARRSGEVARQVEAAVEPISHLVLMSPDDFR